MINAIFKTLTAFLLAVTLFLIITLTCLEILISRPVFTLVYSVVTNDSTNAKLAQNVASQIFSFNLDPQLLSSNCLVTLCFTNEEIDHLNDVHNLYIFLTQTLITFASAASVAVISFQINSEQLIKVMHKLAKIMLLSFVLLSALGLFFWTQFFTIFHQIFFPQGNWSFPTESLLITLYPEAFWQTTAALLYMGHIFSYILVIIVTTRILMRQTSVDPDSV